MGKVWLPALIFRIDELRSSYKSNLHAFVPVILSEFGALYEVFRCLSSHSPSDVINPSQGAAGPIS